MGYSFEQMYQNKYDNRGKNTLNTNLQKPIIATNIKQQALLDAKNQLAEQQALMQEMSQMSYSGITDKVFGKSRSGFGLDPQRLRVGAYIILGAVVGRYVAKNMKKSTTLGMVVGGLAPLLAYQLSISYDRKNMPKQEPKQKVAIEPTPTPMPNKKPYMPQVKPMTIAEEREMAIRFYKTLPDEFVLNNVRYFKNSNLEFYKQPFSSQGLSGVMPIKIGGAEFSNAHIEFRDKNLPKSPFINS
jgi:hypothetical protein